LGIILGQGSVSGSVLKLSGEIISKYQKLENLEHASVQELQAIKGVGDAKATKIKAAFELGKRLQLEFSQPHSDNIFNSLDAYRLALRFLKNKKQEHLLLFCLDTRSRLISEPQTISVGTLDASLLHPREIFITAIRNFASKVILAHNHPSGSSLPSRADLEVTRQVVEAGRVVGIGLIDHIIIGANEYTSIGEFQPALFV
jgi:DNA repair protein RadC